MDLHSLLPRLPYFIYPRGTPYGDRFFSVEHSSSLTSLELLVSNPGRLPLPGTLLIQVFTGPPVEWGPSTVRVPTSTCDVLGVRGISCSPGHGSSFPTVR